jgi:hypothetical protein
MRLNELMLEDSIFGRGIGKYFDTKEGNLMLKRLHFFE